MASLATPARPVKASRPKPERRMNLGTPVNGVYPLLITVGEGERAKRFGYYLEALPADFGVAFRLTKLAHQVEEGHDPYYDVLLDPRGHHSCTCLGNLRWGHKTRCKHVAALAALVAGGKLPDAAGDDDNGGPDDDDRAPGLPYLCTVCGVNPVDAENGFDTCRECLAKQ
jgi:hypothetical protein